MWTHSLTLGRAEGTQTPLQLSTALGREADGLLSRAGEQLLCGKVENKSGFPSKSPSECFCFFLFCAGRFSGPEREKGEVSFPSRTRPVAPRHLRLRCVRCLFAPGARAGPQPRITHNSAHSRLSFLQNLFPEETRPKLELSMARASGSGHTVCQKAPRQGVQAVRGSGDIHCGSSCEGSATLGLV